MVKYNSKGSLPQKADYYALLNRADADWRDSVRQGLCVKGDGVSGRVNYSVALSQGIVPEAGLNDLDLRFNVGADFYELAGGTLPGHFIRCSTGQFSPFSFYCIAGRKDTIGMSVRNAANSSDISTPMTFNRNILKNDIIKITFTAGNPNSSLRFWLNGVEQATSPLVVANVDKIYNHNFATAQMGLFARPDGSRPYSATICNVQIRTGGVLKFFAPLDGTTYDVVTGGVGTITGTVSLAERCDNSTFRNDEYGFAVKSGAIYPKLLDGSGYAGLVGDPDKIYYPGSYPNTFTGNWYELTHAYFDKSNTDIWEDYIRESINYISEEPTYWNVDEISQDYFDKYVKAAYRDKIYCGLGSEDDDYRGAVMVFEGGIPDALLPDLTFWRKRKSFPSDRRVAWVDINTPISLTAAAEGTLTGRGYRVGQHIEVEVRLSGETPEDDWTPFGTATVAGDGSWSVSGTIASADTYDFRVIDENIDPAVCFAQVDDVAVESGVVLTALQITNASDAVTKGNTDVRYSKIVGDKIISSGTTTSSKLQIGENTYLTGVGSGTSTKRWVMCCGKNQIVDWIKFFESSGETINQFADAYNGSVYTAECPARTTTDDGKIKRIIIETGIVTELALSKPASGFAYIGAVFCYDGYVYVLGSSDQYAANSALWKIAPDLSSQTRVDKAGIGRGTDAQIDATTGYIHGNATSTNYRLAISDLSLHSSSASLTYLTKNGAFSTNNRALFSYVDSRVRLRMVAKDNYGTVHFNQEMHGDTASSKMGAVDYDVDKFLVFHNDGAKFYLISVADSNTYSKSDIATITPNSVIGISTFGAWLDHDSTHYLVSGNIRGVMESGFTQGDDTKYDGFIKLIEK